MKEIKVDGLSESITTATTVKRLRHDIRLLEDAKNKIPEIAKDGKNKTSSASVKEILDRRILNLQQRVNKYIATFKRLENDSEKFKEIMNETAKRRQYYDLIRDTYAEVSIDNINDLFGTKESLGKYDKDRTLGFIEFVEGKRPVTPATIVKAIALTGVAVAIGIGASFLTSGTMAPILLGIAAGAGTIALANPLVFKKEIVNAWHRFKENHQAKRVSKAAELQLDADAPVENSTMVGETETYKSNKDRTNEEKRAFNSLFDAYTEVVEAIKFNDTSILKQTNADKSVTEHKSFSEFFAHKIKEIENSTDFAKIDRSGRNDLRLLFSEYQAFIKQLEEKTKGLSGRSRINAVLAAQHEAGILDKTGSPEAPMAQYTGDDAQKPAPAPKKTLGETFTTVRTDLTGGSGTIIPNSALDQFVKAYQGIVSEIASGKKVQLSGKDVSYKEFFTDKIEQIKKDTAFTYHDPSNKGKLNELFEEAKKFIEALEAKVSTLTGDARTTAIAVEKKEAGLVNEEFEEIIKL